VRRGGRDPHVIGLWPLACPSEAAVALLWLLAAIGGGLGIAIDFKSQSWTVAAAGFAFVLAMALFAVYLAGIRVYSEDDQQPASGNVTPILVEFVYKRRVAEVLLDCSLVSLCYYTAYKLRFEDPHEFARNFEMFYKSFPILLSAQIIAFFVVGMYRGQWRHFGMIDTINVAKGVFLGTVGSVLFFVFGYHFFAYSRTVFAIYAVLVLIAVTLSRASFRLVGEFVQRQKRTRHARRHLRRRDGGGSSSASCQSGPDNRLVGFIDDDRANLGHARAWATLILVCSIILALSASVPRSTPKSVDSVRHRLPDAMPHVAQLHNLTMSCSRLVRCGKACRSAPCRASIPRGRRRRRRRRSEDRSSRRAARRGSTVDHRSRSARVLQFASGTAAPDAPRSEPDRDRAPRSCRGLVWAPRGPAAVTAFRVFVAAIVAFYPITTPIQGEPAGVQPERRHEPMQTREEARGADTVVILSGGVETTRAGGVVLAQLSTTSTLRVLEAARVNKLIGGRLVIVSGGIADERLELQPESKPISEALIAAGVPAANIALDVDARDTYDHPRTIRPILEAHHVRQFVIVTSPMHMRRALAVFRKAGFDRVGSVSLLRSDHLKPPPLFVPNDDSLLLSDASIYDYAGWLYYFVRGRL
jgi:uncharacterized SAM-binding protein YcdF (DUF218 family)